MGHDTAFICQNHAPCEDVHRMFAYEVVIAYISTELMLISAYLVGSEAVPRSPSSVKNEKFPSGPLSKIVIHIGAHIVSTK